LNFYDSDHLFFFYETVLSAGVVAGLLNVILPQEDEETEGNLDEIISSVVEEADAESQQGKR